MELMGSLFRIAAALCHTSHELQRHKRKHKFAVGMVYLHQHCLNASREVTLERVLARNSIVLDLLQLLCVGLV